MADTRAMPCSRHRPSLLLLLTLLGAGGLAIAGCGSSGGTADNSNGGHAGNGANGGAAGSINIGGSGGGTGASGGAGGSGAAAPTCNGDVTGVFRDFHSSHPDFECTKSGAINFTDPYNKDCGPWDPAIVGPLGSALGADGKPVYAGGNGTPSTPTGAGDFNQWYHDVPGVNQSMQLVLKLTKSAQGTLVYDTDRFFPIDGKLFAANANDPDIGVFKDDDGNARNFHFTYELHTTFRYQKGNVFTFRGDDDVFVYINGKLAVNIGGIHVPMQGKVDLDTGRVEITAPMGIPALSTMPALGFDQTLAGGGVAGTVDLGLVAGQVYPMDFFFAERNCCASNFRLETNFDFVDCGVIK